MIENIMAMYKKELSLIEYKIAYWYNVQIFLDYLATHNATYSSATYNLYSDFLIFLKSHMKNNSVNVYIRAVRHFYRYLYKIGEVQESLVSVIESIPFLPYKEDAYRDFATLKDIQDMIEMSCEFTEWMSAAKIKAALWFFFTTGLRRKEFCGLSRKDINLQECFCIVRNPKATVGREQIIRSVKFPVTVGKYIEEYFLSEPEEINAFNMTVDQVNFWFKDLKDYCSRINITPHSLRRGFAVYAHSNGMSLRDIQLLLGHKQLSTTLLYVTPSVETAHENYKNKIDAAFERDLENPTTIKRHRRKIIHETVS